MKKSSSSEGCLLAIFLGVLVFGNVLIPSLFVGELDEDNWLGIIMAILAIGLDLVLVCYAISSLFKRNERKKEEKKKQWIKDITEEVEEWMQYYKPRETISLEIAKPLQVEPQYINREIILAVNQLKEEMKETIKQCQEVDMKTKRILRCNGCQTIEDKYFSLMSNLEKLKQYEKESTRLHNVINSKKIQMINEEESIMCIVIQAFNKLLSSKTCLTEGDRFEYNNILPAEIRLFSYKYAPVAIRIDGYYYCLFSKVILVFDESGVFSSAIDPSAMSVQVNRITADVLVTNNVLSTHQFVNTDSKCIAQGQTQHTWRYTCRDGSPDMRYSYANNPYIEYRSDTYEYGEIALSIAGQTVPFYVSSESAIDSFETMGREYIVKYNNMHDSIPDLLELLKYASGKDLQNVSCMIEAYKPYATKKRFFCEII